MFRKIMVFLFLLFFSINLGVIDAQEKSSRRKVAEKLTPDKKWSQWVTILPIDVVVDEFIFNPRDPNSIYALAYYGGIFKTTNSKKSWDPIGKTFPHWSAKSDKREEVRRIGKFDPLEEKEVKRVVRFDPLNPHIIYIAVSTVAPFRVSGSFMRSKDNGRSWEDITGILKDHVIEDVVVDPKSPETIYVACRWGLFKTLNGGKSWGKIWENEEAYPNRGAFQVCLNPESPNEVMILSFGYKLYYSKDGGESFNNITPAIPIKNWRVTMEELEGVRKVFYATFNPHNTQEVFVIGKGRDTTEILKSTDKGQSWKVVSEWNYERHSLSPPIVKALVFHPVESDVIYVITEDERKKNDQILKSMDGGKTWIPLSTLFSTEISDIAKVHALPSYIKISDIAMLPDGTLYAATNYGVYKTIDEGKTWELNSFGLPVMNENLLSIDPHTGFIYIETYNIPGGYWLSSDKGSTWKWYFSPDNCRIRQLITALDGVTYIVSDEGRVFKFTPDGKRSELKFPFVLGYLRGVHSNAQVLYAVAVESVFGVRSYRGSLFKSEDGGFSWFEISKEEIYKRVKKTYSPTRYLIDLLCVDPQFPNTLYIKVEPEGYSSDSVILKTHDGGNSWIDITGNLGFVPNSIVIDPVNSNIQYAYDSVTLLRSDNGGKTWKSIKPAVNSSINDIAIDPLNPKILYLAIDKGVYRSSDSGKTWQSLNDGLLETNIRKVMVSSGMVFAEDEKNQIYKLME